MQPELLAGRNRISKPSDVLKFPLLHLDDSDAWARWFDAAGVEGAGHLHGPVLNRASMVIDAAIDSQGIALARTEKRRDHRLRRVSTALSVA